MRLYTFNNYYLSSIQHGIQTAHVVSELFVKYDTIGIAQFCLNDWAKNHKTIVCLNGGNASDLTDIYDYLHSVIARNLILPYCYFKEDKQSLNECITCVGIIVPEEIYGYDIEDKWGQPLGHHEQQLYDLIKSKRLA